MSLKCCWKSRVAKQVLKSANGLLTAASRLTLDCMLDFIRPVTVTVHVVSDEHAASQFLLEQIALVEEQND